MNRPIAFLLALLLAPVAWLLLRGGAASIGTPPAGEQSPDGHELGEITTWSADLERGAVVRYQHRICDQERAALRQRIGTEPADVYPVGELRTFGPFPQEIAERYVRHFHACGLDQIASAEKAKVDDIAGAKQQAQDLLDGLKADLAARAILEGHYWTITANDQPRLPDGWTYYAAMTDQKGPGGEHLEIFVPLDLHAAELRTAWSALVSLENELRREHAEEFNRMTWDERNAIVQSAERAAHGEKPEHALPSYYYRLEIERRTLLASPRLQAD
ncbi:MAG: hypothetical protein U1F36_07355 [Planctomycetota bacterium]